MEPKERRNIHNLGLVLALSALCCVIIGLVATIIVAQTTHNNNPTPEPSEPEEPLVSSLDDAEIARLEASEKTMLNKQSEIESSVAELLNNEPVDIDQINALYREGIALAKQEKREDYIIVFLRSQMNNLKSKGFKKEALNLLLGLQFDDFSVADRYRLYTDIILLANEIEDTSTVDKYERLRSEIEEEFKAFANSIDNYQKEYENSRTDSDEMKEENE